MEELREESEKRWAEVEFGQSPIEVKRVNYCHRIKCMDPSDDTHDKVYELNKQMCDLEIDRERWDKIGKEWSSKKQEIVDSIFNEIYMGKKKMTKAEAFEWLKHKKVYVGGNSAVIQEKLFEAGFEWAENKRNISNLEQPFLILSEGGGIFYSNNMCHYLERSHEEISADDILSIEIVEENRSEDELVEIVELGKKIQCLLSKLSGHRHVVITETDVLLYDEGMCLFHSDPF